MSTLEVGEYFFANVLASVLVPFLVDIALEIIVMKDESLMRRMRGRRTGRDAHVMLMPACTVVQTSVFEYDGTRLLRLYPRTTLTMPVNRVLVVGQPRRPISNRTVQNLQSTQCEDAQHRNLPSPRHLHPDDDADRHPQDDDVQQDFTRSTSHPEQVVIEAVPRVCEAVDPAPFQGDTVRESCDRAADPPSDDEKGRKVKLYAECIRYTEDAVVHEQDTELGCAGDSKV